MSRIILSRFNTALLAVMLCITAAGFWFFSPDHKLPRHWNWHGDVDGWGPTGRVLLLLPLAAGVITLFFWVLGRWILRIYGPHGGRQYALGLSCVLAVFVVLQMMIVGYGLGYPVDVPRASALVVAVFFVVIGNVLPKMQPSALRLGWPKSLDPSQQHRTRRLTGVVMMVSGFGLLIAAVLDPPSAWLNFGILLAALVPAAAGLLYTLRLRSEQSHNG